jgi:hypothetical protein
MSHLVVQDMAAAVERVLRGASLTTERVGVLV